MFQHFDPPISSPAPSSFLGEDPMSFPSSTEGVAEICSVCEGVVCCAVDCLGSSPTHTKNKVHNLSQYPASKFVIYAGCYTLPYSCCYQSTKCKHCSTIQLRVRWRWKSSSRKRCKLSSGCHQCPYFHHWCKSSSGFHQCFYFHCHGIQYFMGWIYHNHISKYCLLWFLLYFCNHHSLPLLPYIRHCHLSSLLSSSDRTIYTSCLRGRHLYSVLLFGKYNSFFARGRNFYFATNYIHHHPCGCQTTTHY